MVTNKNTPGCSKSETKILVKNLSEQIKIVEQFNTLFEEIYGVPSGLYFDVTLYVADKIFGN